MIGIAAQFNDLADFRRSFKGSILFVTSKRNSLLVEKVLDVRDRVMLVSGEPSICDIDLDENAHLCDIVVALGGGAVIDWAKYVYVKQQKIHLTVDRNGIVRLNRTPRLGGLYAIPTLLGSGAEWSSSCPLKSEGRKVYLAHQNLIPKALNIPTLCVQNYSSDSFKCQTADIFAHLFESLFSRKISRVNRDFCNDIVLKMKRVIELDSSFSFNDLYLYNFFAGKAQDSFLVGPAHALAHTHLSHLNHARAVAIAMHIIYRRTEYLEVLKDIGFSTDFFDSIWLDYYRVLPEELNFNIDWTILKGDVCMIYSKLK